ncbi:hypothetical protein WSM22_07800 [Cytophagales bacterium WSM2-2]|nr:hypothetical protein WSM22_07800 [Cytophagales bacterium WSM2-2]
MSQINRNLKGGRTASRAPEYVLLNVEDSNGKSVLQNKKLGLFAFGQAYESERLELQEGTYKLTQFQILSAGDTMIYASPLAGSSLAQYVAKPLPITFTITKDSGTLVVPQVLAVTSTDTPNNFGYAGFEFEIVAPLRVIKFELYTDQDFSNDLKNIIFEPSVSAGSVVLWDSTFAPMPIKNVPKADHMISFKVTTSNNADLRIGFRYTIPGVGNSWYYEQMLSGEKMKTVSFVFK